MRTVQKRSVRAILSIVILVCGLLPSSKANGFGLSDTNGHPWITKQGLSFLKSDIIDKIIVGNESDDIWHQTDASYHFDSCSFEDSSDNIRSLYTRTTDALNLNPSDYDLIDAPAAFGQLLHTTQDFYAHSNWVEMGRTDLFNNTEVEWPHLDPRSVYNGVTILQGENADFFAEQFGSLLRTPGTALVDVTRPDGTHSPGLMSGTLPKPYPVDVCPNRVEVGHWYNPLYPDDVGGLNKDGPDDDPVKNAKFLKAQALAVRQTTHEWCRLVSLVHTRYPKGGKAKLFDAWVADPQQALSACNPSTNVALIIDETGSMYSNDPARGRIEAAKLFIDAANVGDRIAVVSFDTSARVQAPLTTILTDDDRTKLKQAVDKIRALGSTDINSGLNGGYQALALGTSDQDRGAALLLTDGGQNSGPYRDDSHLQYKQRGWPVYTIGLGTNTDPVLLTKIAKDTGGEYTESLDPSSLTRLYFDISQRLANGRPAFDTDLLLNQGEQQQFAFMLPPGQQAASIVTTWPGSDVSVRLTSPSGQVINPASTSWDVRHAKGSIYELYTLYYPEPGQWHAELTGITLAPQGERVQLRASVRGPSAVYLPIVSRSVSDAAIIPTRKPTVTLVPNPASTSVGEATATSVAPVKTASAIPSSTNTSAPFTPTAKASMPTHTATATRTATPTQTSVPANCRASSSTWQNTSFNSQNGAFVTTFDMTPNAANMDGVFGLSASSAAGYGALAVIIRFNTDGYIDARNGSVYQATSQVAYSPGNVYHFRVETNLLSHTFNAFVTPPGGNEAIIGENFDFRSEQSAITSLNTSAVYAAKGTHLVCNVTTTPAANIPGLAGTWLGSLTQDGSFSFGVLTEEVMTDGYLELGTSPTCGGKFQDFGPATIVGNTFVDHISSGSAKITISGTFHSSSSASGTYRVVDTTAGASCSLNLDWTATKS